MLEELTNLGSSDPKLGKAAALNVLKHVSENKKELEYLVKRLIHGLESTKLHTRSGSFATLAILLQLRKLIPANLYESMQKALITNKQSTKKERRLIYIARILCLGSILKSVKAADLLKPVGLLGTLVRELVDLSTKKSSYFQLATPFLAHLLDDDTLTQDAFDNIVWPEVSNLFSAVLHTGNKKKKKDEDDEEEENQDEEETVAVNFGCCVQLALVCKVKTYKEDFDCLTDVPKIAKALLVCKFQFEDSFLTFLFKFIKDSPTDVETFWDTLLDALKSTQFELLCLSVAKAVETEVPLGLIISKRLIHYLLSVCKTKDYEFIARAKSTIQLLLKWDDKDGKSRLGKKERKSALKVLFGGEPPNLLHEYAKLNPIVRSFINNLKEKDLKNLREIIFGNFEDDKLGVRMAIVYLNVLVRIAVSGRSGDETMFEIGKKLVCIAVGKDVIDIKKKGDDEDEEMDQEDNQIQMRTTALEGIKTIMSNTYRIKFMEDMWEFLSDQAKELGKEKTVQTVKDVRKVVKKVENPHFKYLITAYTLRVLLDEKEAVSTSLDGVNELLEIGSGGIEGDVIEEVVRFVTTRVVRDISPCISVEGMFTRLMIEGLVNEGIVQELANSVEIDVEEGEGEEEDSEEDEDDDDENEGMEVEADSDSDDEDDDSPEAKKTKLDPAQIAKLKEVLGAGDGSDSEESVALEDATSEDLERTNEQLAKILAIKKLGKDEDNSQLRAIMRSLRLIDVYVVRNIKCIGVSSLLILLLPVINCLKTSLRFKKFSDVTTRVMGVVDNLCRVKKFSGLEELAEGTLGSIATELYEIGKTRKYKILRELMEHCVLMVLRCFLASEKSKKDSKAILKLVFDAVDNTANKLKRRKKRKMKGKNAGNQLETSRFVRLVLETIGDSWKSGRKKIEARVCEVKDGVVNGH